MKNKIDYAQYFFDRSVIIFFIKLLIVLLIISGYYFAVSLNFININPISSLNEKVALTYLKGLVGNAESFYTTSLEYEKRGRYAKAIVEMQYAISLLESKAYNPNKIECYRRRLAYLQQEKLFYEGF